MRCSAGDGCVGSVQHQRFPPEAGMHAEVHVAPHLQRNLGTRPGITGRILVAFGVVTKTADCPKCSDADRSLPTGGGHGGVAVSSLFEFAFAWYSAWHRRRSRRSWRGVPFRFPPARIKLIQPTNHGSPREAGHLDDFDVRIAFCVQADDLRLIFATLLRLPIYRLDRVALRLDALSGHTKFPRDVGDRHAIPMQAGDLPQPDLFGEPPDGPGTGLQLARDVLG